MTPKQQNSLRRYRFPQTASVAGDSFAPMENSSRRSDFSALTLASHALLQAHWDYTWAVEANFRPKTRRAFPR
jgi:hypothetical protein